MHARTHAHKRARASGRASGLLRTRVHVGAHASTPKRAHAPTCANTSTCFVHPHQHVHATLRAHTRMLCACA
eukprot:1172476-Alexandrium_andersonii.AAC.1